MDIEKTTKHAQARFFSRYGREISVEELRHIQDMLRHQLGDTQYIGRVKRGEEDSYLSCYHGTYDEIEFFALCDPETLVIVTFLKEDQINHFEEVEL
ncbi:hypothetical protein M902_0737 [Bacteriovorax sp. BAL6_X]|uniref:hypothetical protein n=1 Tax=Bacteriovorax sp. BAL6_X TaxID=1201290 RepID=UPI000385FE9F|nr:hypothetical protein [Bacteriovorax sp. BAL6_X]EPZ49358.1 hypothetical protein M902_0737 [Bacteriovorax sp. BAL6_X]